MAPAFRALNALRSAAPVLSQIAQGPNTAAQGLGVFSVRALTTSQSAFKQREALNFKVDGKTVDPIAAEIAGYHASYASFIEAISKKPIPLNAEGKELKKWVEHYTACLEQSGFKAHSPDGEKTAAEKEKKWATVFAGAVDGAKQAVAAGTEETPEVRAGIDVGTIDIRPWLNGRGNTTYEQWLQDPFMKK